VAAIKTPSSIAPPAVHVIQRFMVVSLFFDPTTQLPCSGGGF